MFIRMLIGLYAGEIRDVHEEEAHGLIARGQAENPYSPMASKAPQKPVTPEKPAATQPGSLGKKGKR